MLMNPGLHSTLAYHPQTRMADGGAGLILPRPGRQRNDLWTTARRALERRPLAMFAAGGALAGRDVADHLRPILLDPDRLRALTTNADDAEMEMPCSTATR